MKKPIQRILILAALALAGLALPACNMPGSAYAASLGQAVIEDVKTHNLPDALAATEQTKSNFWGGAR